MTDLITKIPEIFVSPSDGVKFLKAIKEQEDKLEAELSATKKLRNALETHNLPELFDTFEQSDCTTLDGGARAVRKLKVYGALPKVSDKDTPEQAAEHRKAREAAMALAIEYGWEPMIKVEVSAQYDKGDRDKADKAFAYLRGDNSAVVEKTENIHSMTLQKAVRDRIESGEPVDFDTLGVTAMTAIVLAPPKKEKR